MSRNSAYIGGDIFPVSQPWWMAVQSYPFFRDSTSAAANDLPVDHGAWVSTVGTASGSGQGQGSFGRPQSGASGPAVQSGSPAAQAGITDGDIITAVDGVTIDPTHPLVELLAQYAPGTKVTLGISRGAEQLQLAVTLGTRPQTTGLLAGTASS